MKVCSTCKCEKDISEFCKKRSTADGYDYNCRTCKARLSKEYRALCATHAAARRLELCNLPKVCAVCKLEKPRTDFNIKNSMRDGVESYCKECSKVRGKEAYKKRKVAVSCALNDFTGTKVCAKCATEKPKTAYYKSSGTYGGLMHNCIECTKAVQYEKRHLIYALVSRAKARAKDNKLPFNLTTDYVATLINDLDNPICPVLGIPMTWRQEKAGTNHVASNSLSLDRIVPERGYVEGNVAVISMLANQIKTNATYHDIFKVAEWLKNAIAQEKEARKAK